MVQFERIILLFFLYSFIGWLWETIYCSLKAKHFVYRGFLIGPITPIYGFGILGVVYLLRPLHEQVIPLFFAAALLVTVLEYVTSYLLERFFHASWWDYKEVPLNINGRVALPISLFLGRVLCADCSICSSTNAGNCANIECSGRILIARFLINGSFF